jgi:bacteriocin leader peptide (microcyclamide/patellamide family)
MDKKNISPNPQQPVDRVPTGQLPTALAELSEESLGSQAQAGGCPGRFEMEGMADYCVACSYDGEDE